MRFKNLKYSHTDELFDNERDIKFVADFVEDFQGDTELLTVEIWVVGDTVNVVIVDGETNEHYDTTPEEALHTLKEFIKLNLENIEEWL